MSEMNDLRARQQIWEELGDPLKYPGGETAWQAEVNRRWAERLREPIPVFCSKHALAAAITGLILDIEVTEGINGANCDVTINPLLFAAIAAMQEESGDPSRILLATLTR